MWFMLDLGPIIKILGEPYDMERFRIYRYWSWGKSSPVPRHRFSVLGFQQPTSGCHPIWPLWTRNSLPPSLNWRTTDEGDLFHSNTQILGQMAGRNLFVSVCVRPYKIFCQAYKPVYTEGRRPTEAFKPSYSCPDLIRAPRALGSNSHRQRRP